MTIGLHEPMPVIIRGDARKLPLADESVDLVVTSPPYYALRSYSDGGEHYDGQIGSEPTWQRYLDSLIECTREMVRVLKPRGSIWLNLGDKYVSDNRGSGIDSKRGKAKYAPVGPRGFAGNGSIPQKSLMLLPHRYAIRCTDELGLIVRQDQVWKRDNGLRESVTDRTRREHEYLFHMVKQPRYYSAVDELREPHVTHDALTRRRTSSYEGSMTGAMNGAGNPLGKLPGSVWSIPTQPLNVPDHISHQRCCDGRKRAGCEEGLGHYAAFPFELVRPIILGWSPRDVCTRCGEGRRPVAGHTPEWKAFRAKHGMASWADHSKDAIQGNRVTYTTGLSGAKIAAFGPKHMISSYACACPDTAAPTTPGVVVDPFGGTGSAPLVAAMNGRTGISIDASWDYCDVLARWRVNDPKERARAAGLDPETVARIIPVAAEQKSLWDSVDEAAS